MSVAFVPTAQAGPNEWFDGVVLDAEDPCKVTAKYKNAEGGLLYSDDGGRSFRVRPSSTFDPNGRYDDKFHYTVTADGTTLVGDFAGLTQDAADACTWAIAEDPLVTSRVAAFASHPTDASITYVATTSGSADQRTGIVQRAADGSFTALGGNDTGADGLQRFWVNELFTVALEGATGGVRFYESGLLAGEGEDSPNLPALRYSDDAGETWTEHPLTDAKASDTLRLWLVDPDDADRILVTVRNEGASQEGELDAVLVSDDGGATYRPWIEGEVSHVSTVTRAADGTVYLGDEGYSMLFMPPQGVWRGTLDEAPTKISEVNVRCLAVRPQDGALFVCQGEMEFGRLDPESGEFFRTFTFEHAESFVECPGEDLVQVAKPQMCGDAWCGATHYPFSLICQSYDEPTCGPMAGLSFSGDEPKVIEPLPHVVDPLCPHARDDEPVDMGDAGTDEPDEDAATPEPTPGGDEDAGEDAGGPSPGAPGEPQQDAGPSKPAPSRGDSGGCASAPGRGAPFGWLPVLACLAFLRFRRRDSAVVSGAAGGHLPLQHNLRAHLERAPRFSISCDDTPRPAAIIQRSLTQVKLGSGGSTMVLDKRTTGIFAHVLTGALVCAGCSSDPDPSVPPGGTTAPGANGLSSGQVPSATGATGSETGAPGANATTGGGAPVTTTGGATGITTDPGAGGGFDGGAPAPTSGATGDSTTGGGAPSGSQEWCAVKQVFEARCNTCHSDPPAAGAPMPLVTHDQMMAASPTMMMPVHEAVVERVNNPDNPMPPVAYGPLTAEEDAALDAWVAAGTPAGPADGCADTGDTGEPKANEWPEECEEFFELTTPPHTVRAGTETREDYNIPVPWSGEVYALALKPITNNKRVVHHWILYDGLAMVTSWSPGKEFETFPEGVGVYMPPSGSLRLNMHYYNKFPGAKDEEDQSGIEVCITRKKVPHVATTNMFIASATVPPQQRVENTAECTVSTRGEEVHLITSSPHMHSYGRHAKFEVIRTDGSVETLHDTPFNWEDQSIKPIDVVLHDGDKVRTTCVYQNDTNQTIRFGESSEDEMCMNFARYYPRNGFTCGGFGGLGGGLTGGGSGLIGGF